MENVEVRFEISSNLRQLYEAVKDKPFVEKYDGPAWTMVEALDQLIAIKHAMVVNLNEQMDQDEPGRDQFALQLFENNSLAEGAEDYYKMFLYLAALPAAKKYKKQLAGFAKWISASVKNDELLDVIIDRKLLDRAPKNKKIMEFLISKYEFLHHK